MATIFDRETLLDLTVNVIPLGIILFFAVGYLIFNPWAEEGLFGNLLMIGLHAVPFVALAILTYVSGKAIAGDEKRAEVYFQGQAAMADAEPRVESEDEVFGDETHEDDLPEQEPSTVEDGSTADEAATDETAADEPTTDEQRTAEGSAASGSETGSS